MSELHEAYAPILRFAKGERFFPMRAEDFMQYSALFARGRNEPIAPRGSVMPDQLARQGRSTGVFLRSVDAGPLQGPQVVAQWGKRTVDLVYQWTQRTGPGWSESLARTAYKWFSGKTQAATELFWWNKLLIPALEKASSGKADDLPRLMLPQETRDEAADRYASLSSPVPAYTYYHRQVRDGDYLCLQYWFFYGYNDWARGFEGLNDHEGDWESMMLFFRVTPEGKPREPPAYITFVGHHSRLTKPWYHSDVELIGSHPVGYVAAGSHATYPEAKPYSIMELYNLVDYATGDGVAVDHDQWAHRIAVSDVPWLTSYQGSWGTRFWLPVDAFRTALAMAGTLNPALRLASSRVSREIELPGVSAPHGPRVGDTGDQRPQWAGPVEWAGVPRT